MTVKNRHRRRIWEHQGQLLAGPEARRQLLTELVGQEVPRPATVRREDISLKGMCVFDLTKATSEDVRRFMWAGLRELRVLAKAKGWEEEEVQRLLVSAYDVFHDASASIWAAMKTIASSMRDAGRGRSSTFIAGGPLILLARDAESTPQVTVPCANETASAGGGSGGGEKKTSSPSEHPALEGLNRAYFLQAEQVRTYRARRDADLDDLDDLEAD